MVINNEYKNRMVEGKGGESGFMVTWQVLGELRRKNRELEGELADKNAHIEDLTTLLDSFDLEFDRKYSKPKFSKEVQALLSETTHKLNSIHSLLDEVKKTDQFYEKVKKEVEEGKRSFDQERAEDKRALAMEKARL